MNETTATNNFVEPVQILLPHNAWLITPKGIRVSMNISPEAAANVVRYGCKVEWFTTAGKQVA